MSGFFSRPQVLATFNINGVVSGATRVDDNTMKKSTDQEWVAQYDGTLKKVTFSAGLIVGSPTYDLNIFVNAVLKDTVSLVAADMQSIHAIAIPVVKGDKVSMTVLRTSGAGDTFEDSFMELWG